MGRKDSGAAGPSQPVSGSAGGKAAQPASVRASPQALRCRRRHRSLPLTAAACLRVPCRRMR